MLRSNFGVRDLDGVVSARLGTSLECLRFKVRTILSYSALWRALR